MPNIILFFQTELILLAGYMFLLQNTPIQFVANNVGVIIAQTKENVGDDSGFTFIYWNITSASNSTILFFTLHAEFYCCVSLLLKKSFLHLLLFANLIC